MGGKSAQEEKTDKKTKCTKFEQFWLVYPSSRKQEKAKAMKIWKEKKLDLIADQIIDDVNNRKKIHKAWVDGFSKVPFRYLQSQGWEDPIVRDPRLPFPSSPSTWTQREPEKILTPEDKQKSRQAYLEATKMLVGKVKLPSSLISHYGNENAE